MHPPPLQSWITHLRGVAGDPAADARDLGLGPLGEPFLAAVQHREPVSHAPLPAGSPAETALWWAVVDKSIDLEPILGSPVGDGPLIQPDGYKAIEVWTESELCGLHALWRIARERGRDDWRLRLGHARQWHLENTQPDNATNRPWGLHVFLRGGTPEATHYAETLLHNAQVGGVDTLSALILLDAAQELELVNDE